MSAPDPALVAACESAELAAVASWYRTVPASVAAALKIGAEPVGDALLVHAAADVLLFNRVLGLGIQSEARASDLDRALARYAAFGVQRCMVQLAPAARPAELVAWLEERGLARHNHWIRLARDTSPPAAARTTLAVRRMGPEHALAFGRLAGEAFGHPPELAEATAGVVGEPGWSFFGAFDGDLLIGAGGLHVAGEVGWLGFAATRASHRGRGAQSAVIAARIAAARAAGCRLVCTETAPDPPDKPNPSTHNLRRLGFADLYARDNWLKRLQA